MIFIDSNMYLDLYRMAGGKKLLPAITEQRKYIFVTEQVVNEVLRNKVKVAAGFFSEQAKNEKLELKVDAPRHFHEFVLACIQLWRLWRSKKPDKMSKNQKDELRREAHASLEQISRSEDEVSEALAKLFSNAVTPGETELEKARRRKELGDAPGKKNDPLGDELNWEQILSRYKPASGLWIIARDSDYATKYEGKMFFNAALYQELAASSESAPKVFCFNNITDGIKHFAETTGAGAEKLPTPQEAEQIKKEEEALPPLGWLTNYDDANTVVMQNYQRQAEMMLRAALASQAASENVVLPPEDQK